MSLRSPHQTKTCRKEMMHTLLVTPLLQSINRKPVKYSNLHYPYVNSLKETISPVLGWQLKLHRNSCEIANHFLLIRLHFTDTQGGESWQTSGANAARWKDERVFFRCISGALLLSTLSTAHSISVRGGEGCRPRADCARSLCPYVAIESERWRKWEIWRSLLFFPPPSPLRQLPHISLWARPWTSDHHSLHG